VTMARILIIEDEDSILMPLEDDLTLEGYSVTGEMDGARGLQRAQTEDFDLIILDIMLPGMSGLEICKSLRHEGHGTPILMLTAKSQEIDKVLGLEMGADDYVTKPFSRRELLARVKALLRRGVPAKQPLASACFGDVEVDFRGYEVKKAGRTVELTAREFALLHLLVTRGGEVLSRGVILDEVWGDDNDVFPRTVDAHIAHLRKKVEDDPADPRFLVNVRGVGYKFVPDSG